MGDEKIAAPELEELPEVLSPTANVRRTCLAVVQGEDYEQGLVRIQDEPLEALAQSLEQEFSLQAVEWDAEGWHYNGEGYERKHAGCQAVEAMRTERIALYILALDAINFCFWPTTAETKENRFEYEHLAIALQRVAQQDDRLEEGAEEEESVEHWSVDEEDARVVRAESSFALAPSNLARLTADELQSWMERYLPEKETTEDAHEYVLPNLQERVRLLQELGAGLMMDHGGSATALLKSCHKSADRLVHSILQSFPGFRDAACRGGHAVYFYKRAQIAVADLWSALCYSRPQQPHSLCEFNDIDKLTTFADYRVPQLLRHVGVLEYHPRVANRVDAGQILGPPACPEEIAIRAATVVAVDRLVGRCSSLLSQRVPKTNSLCAVTLDWYLWQWGERLDRHGTVGKFHRVETIYY